MAHVVRPAQQAKNDAMITTLRASLDQATRTIGEMGSEHERLRTLIAQTKIERNHAMQTVGEQTVALSTAIRELERWRHGQPIEGDFVCPDSLALTEARAEIKRLRHTALALWRLLDDIDTLDDSCREYDEAFRAATRRKHKKRWEILSEPEVDALMKEFPRQG